MSKLVQKLIHKLAYKQVEEAYRLGIGVGTRGVQENLNRPQVICTTNCRVAKCLKARSSLGETK